MSDHNANQDTAKPGWNAAIRKAAGLLAPEAKHSAYAAQLRSCILSLEKAEPSTPQSAERMTAEQLHKSDMTKWWSCDDPVTWEFAEAFAEHCTAALTRELAELKKVGLDNLLSDQEAYDELTKSAESSAALVKELATMLDKLQLRAKDAVHSMMTCQTATFGCRPGLSDAISKAESLLSDPAVKKVLEK